VRPIRIAFLRSAPAMWLWLAIQATSCSIIVEAYGFVVDAK
jgi:hypothetical protein